MRAGAGKKNVFSSGNSSPEAMILIKKDMDALSIRKSSKGAEDLSRHLDDLHKESLILTSDILTFKKHQQSDFGDLWTSISILEDLIRSTKSN